MPEQVSTPPFSTLARRACAAGVSRNFANKSLVAVFANAGAKPGKDRRDRAESQVGGRIGLAGINRNAAPDRAAEARWR